MTFPSLCYSGRYSPFETPPPPRFEKRRKEKKNKTREKKEVESTSQDKSLTPISCNPSPWQPRKKDVSYCECCQQPFTNLQEHLQSEQHRTFVLDPSNYSVVDKLVADMLPGFNPSPSELSEETLNRPPTTSLPIHDVCELEPLSDVETERAVQALQRQGSSFSICISSPTRAPLSFGPAGPSPGSQFPIPNPDTLRGDIQSFSPTECQFPVIQPHTPSPAILDVKPQAHDLASQQPDFPHLSPCPQTPPPAPDPYSLPPLLSPQAPYSSIMEPHNLYSEPPVLSPQQYIVEEAVEGVICEMDSAECLSKSVSAVTLPVSTTLLPSVAVTNAEGVKGSNQDGLFLLSGFVCSSSGLDCDKLASCRSRSLSRQSATAANRKKRCRSASPECSLSKTRRVTATFDYSSRWTELYHTSANPERDIMAKPEGCLLFDQTSCQMIQSCPNPNVSSMSSLCAVETVGLKETSTTFCAPAVQNLTQAPNQIDILCHDSTSVAHQPSWPLSSKTKFFDPPLQFSSDKPQNCPSSLSQSTSVCIESTLIPDLATLSPSSSDSDWDCDLLSRLGPTLATSLPPTEQSCELDKDLLQRPCTWMHDTSYESHLHTALHMSTPTASLCGEETDPSAFSRTLVQIVKVQH
uniref:uncharacterized protein LOC109963072 n=1 Tax=Monopterus albus TaxID=43700 RepID=UPI0009B3375D|nr:uncharacterized protein LOC109963072 [Monopterus albus]